MKKHYKYLIVSNETPPAGGVSVILQFLHHEVLRLSESYTLVSGRPTTEAISIDWSSNFGTGYVARRNLGPLTLLPSIWSIRNNSYDIVILNDVRSVYTFEVASRLGIFPEFSSVCTLMHGSEIERYVQRCSWRRKLLLYPYFYKSGLKRARRVLYFGKELMDRNTKDYKSLGMLNDLKINLIRPFKLRSIEGAKNVAIGQKKRFVTACRLDLNKGFRKMAIIMKALVEKGYEVSWDIYGEGKDRKKIHDIIVHNNIDNITFFKGYFKNTVLISMYDQYDFFICLSDYPEGFGLAWYEAGYNGLKVLGSANGELPHIIELFEGCSSNSHDELLSFVEKCNERRYYKKDALKPIDTYFLDQIQQLLE